MPIIQAQSIIELKYDPNFYGDDVNSDAIAAIERGNMVLCTKHEYLQSVRNAVLTQAGKWVDTNDNIRARIALSEVKRLDKHFSLTA